MEFLQKKEKSHKIVSEIYIFFAAGWSEIPHLLIVLPT